MHQEIPVILNPFARSAKAASLEEPVRALDPRIRLYLPDHAGHATELAEQLVLAGAPLVVAAGGDGTINEVAHGIALGNAARVTNNGPAKMGVLPSGTMNVFATELGLPNSLAAAWAVIERGQSVAVDLWRANDRYFVQLAGAGPDAAIIQETTWENKLAFGPLSYLFSAAGVLSGPAHALTVHLPMRDPVICTLALIGNGRFYGGPFRIFPEAKNNDGLLDVVLFLEHGLGEVLYFLGATMTQTLKHSETIMTLQTPELRIEASPSAPFEADGELAGETPVWIRQAREPLLVMA